VAVHVACCRGRHGMQERAVLCGAGAATGKQAGMQSRCVQGTAPMEEQQQLCEPSDFIERLSPSGRAAAAPPRTRGVAEGGWEAGQVGTKREREGAAGHGGSEVGRWRGGGRAAAACGGAAGGA
jgi:hypothetical protein